MSSKFDRFGFLQYDAEKNTGMYPPDPGDTIFDDAFRHCPGWTNLLLSFCEKVTALFEFYHMDVNKSLVILQAKEKFGGIRIYCEDTPNRQLNRKLDTLCTNLLEASEKVCSQCGAPASVHSTGWVLPYCIHCATEDMKARNARHKTNFDFGELFRPIKKLS